MQGQVDDMMKLEPLDVLRARAGLITNIFTEKFPHSVRDQVRNLLFHGSWK